MPEQQYSVKATCQLLGGISEVTLWRLRKQGRIKFVRVGNRPMFLASQIEAYQQAAVVGATHPNEQPDAPPDDLSGLH
jgi:predicted site-specific integrase-resolvase